MTGTDFVKWRKYLGKTQNETAELFKVTRQTVINWEKSTVDLPRYLDYACSAVYHRMIPWYKLKEMLHDLDKEM